MQGHLYNLPSRPLGNYMTDQPSARTTDDGRTNGHTDREVSLPKSTPRSDWRSARKL